MLETRTPDLRPRRSGSGRVAWVLPLAVGVFLLFSPLLGGPRKPVVALVALPALYWVVRHVERALLLLVTLLPFQLILPAALYAYGMPGEIVAPLRFWRDLLVAGIVIAGYVAHRRNPRRLDGLDWLAFAYVLLVAVYALIPRLLVSDAPIGFDVRLSGFRANAGFALLFLACRRIPWSKQFRARFGRRLIWVAAIVGGAAVFEFVFSDTWNYWLTRRFEVPKYQFDILEAAGVVPYDVRIYDTIGSREIVRVGSVYVAPLVVGFALALAFAVSLEHWLRGRRTVLATIALLGAGLATLMSQTRSAVLAVGLAALVAFKAWSGFGGARRTRLGLLLAAGLIVALPVAGAIGLIDRTKLVADEQDTSTQAHNDSRSEGWHNMLDRPLGHGLGTSAGVGQRLRVRQLTVQENYYLQVGNETGVLSMVLFIGFEGMLLARLWRATRERRDVLSFATLESGVGIAVAAFFLHAWAEPQVAWPWFCAAAVALAVHRPEPDGEDEGDEADDELVPLRASNGHLALGRPATRW